MVAVAFTRDEHDAASLHWAVSSSRDAEAARRMLALALIVDGQPRSEAATLCGMDRQTLRDWVHRYNAEGLAGLSDRRGAVGPKPPCCPSRRRRWPSWCVPAPTRPSTAWCAGGGSTSRR
jgi:hypothetical protein